MGTLETPSVHKYALHDRTGRTRGTVLCPNVNAASLHFQTQRYGRAFYDKENPLGYLPQDYSIVEKVPKRHAAPAPTNGNGHTAEPEPPRPAPPPQQVPIIPRPRVQDCIILSLLDTATRLDRTIAGYSEMLLGAGISDCGSTGVLVLAAERIRELAKAEAGR